MTIDDSDLSEETLATDICDVIERVTENFENTSPDVVLVGHSMGGALAVHAALAEKPIANLVRQSIVLTSGIDFLKIELSENFIEIGLSNFAIRRRPTFSPQICAK